MPPRPRRRTGKRSEAGVLLGWLSDVGRVRSSNEDALLVHDLDHGRTVATGGRAASGTALLLAVCDGLGGAAGGEVASRMATEVILRSVSESRRAASPGGAAETLRLAVLAANREILEVARNTAELAGMGTTSTVAVLEGDALVFAHVGDSRCYLLRRGRLNRLTRDQSLSEALVDLGVVSQRQARAFGGGNVLLQAVGTEESLEVVTCRAALRRGDTLLLCSDGLTTALPDNAIREVLLRPRATPATLASALVAAACEAGGPDNVSVIVARVEDRRLPPPAGANVELEVLS